jgi:lipoprotein-anchoring transpeptidase ErfK/SrfK
MKSHRLLLAFSLASLALLGLAPEAEAQLFGARKKVTKPAAFINRQAPPKIDKDLEDQINPSNSTVHVSLGAQRAYLKIAGTDQVYIDTPVSTGKKAGSTPMGTFKITQKNADHRSSIYGDFVDSKGRVVRAGISTKVDSAPAGTRYRGAPMRWFCRLTDTGIGMHTGILPGYPASHGCIRLPDEIAQIIFQKVRLGTTVTIGP